MNALNAATSDLPVSFANKMQVGVMNYKYKGIPTLKCPMDMALYLNVFWELKPATVIEFGSHMGGSALWIADMLEVMEIKTQKIISLDLDRKVNFEDSRIEFRKCDTNNIAETLQISLVEKLPHPFLIIDDASHQYQQVLNVLDYSHKITTKGDYIIIEDGFISIVGAENQHNYNGGPFQAIHKFLEKNKNEYEIDRDKCDFYGRNVTWNCDGFLKRIK